MKNSKPIVIFSLVALLLCVVGGYAFVVIDANSKAKKLATALKKYEIDEAKLITGEHLDLSKDKLKEIDFKIDRGKLFIDEDKEVTIYEEIMIDGLVCKNIFDKPNCSITNPRNGLMPEMQMFRTYEVGQEVTLKDDSKWYVIHDSDEYSKYVILMQDKRIDINQDGFTMDTGLTEDPDRVAFDPYGSKKYDENKEGTVAYFIENTYRNDLYLEDILDFRLLTLEELEAIKEKINFKPLSGDVITQMMNTETQLLNSIYFEYESPRPYHKLKDIVITPEQEKALMPHWLFNSCSGNFWIMDGNKAKTAVWNGDGYTTPKATTKYSVKPVMVIKKDNIKES